MTFKAHLIDDAIRSAYGLTVTDLNGNGHPDILVGSTGLSVVARYAGPDFEKQILTEAHPGNITLAAHDLTGNGFKDLIVGSGFNRRQRIPVEYLQWQEASEDGTVWTSHYIEAIPYLHRMALVDIPGSGNPLLFVASLRGLRGEFNTFQDPGSLWCYRLPEDPVNDPWEKRLINGALHLNHGMGICDVDGDGRPDILIGARNGLIWFEPPEDPFSDPWQKWTISPRESSEVFAADLDGDGVVEMLSVEPWHGNELVWYKAEGDIRTGTWTRHPIDTTLNRGHSLYAADLDGDGVVEVLSGYNGPGTSLHLYRPKNLNQNQWHKETVDDGGLGMGQMEVVDLNGNGRPDIAASGMSTGNVKWYENLG